MPSGYKERNKINTQTTSPRGHFHGTPTVAISPHPRVRTKAKPPTDPSTLDPIAVSARKPQRNKPFLAKTHLPSYWHNTCTHHVAGLQTTRPHVIVYRFTADESWKLGWDESWNRFSQQIIRRRTIMKDQELFILLEDRIAETARSVFRELSAEKEVRGKCHRPRSGVVAVLLCESHLPNS